MADLEHDLIVPVEEIEAFLAARGATLRQLERGELPTDLQEVQTAILYTDPVVWSEANLVNRPEDGGGLWRFFGYQKPSIRYRGDVVHEDGAEVGKTRELVALILWGGCLHQGGMLVGASQDSDLDEMWEEIEWQRERNPWIDAQIKETRLKPHRKLTFRNGNIVRFRPAGHDGRAFRAVHVAQFGFFDEAAKPSDPAVFSEFFRALKPGCEARFYSVPDGRRGSPFYNLCERAVPYHPELGRGGKSRGAKRKFVRFSWPKTLMPAPYWSPERDQEAIERYGGRDSPGYVRNVLGQWGDPEDTVFPWAQFRPCVRYVEEYIRATVLVDQATSSVYVDAHRLTPGYEVRGGSDLVDEDSVSAGPLTEVFRERYEIGNFELAPVLRRVFEAFPGSPHLVAGADVGRSGDEPTEIGVSELRGMHRRWAARLQLKHVSWDQQATAAAVIDEIFRPDHGWGLDATGVGKVLEENLRGAEGGYRWDGHLTGYVFNSKLEVIDPQTGEPSLDPATQRPKKITVKEMATQLLEQDMQRGNLVVPWDPDYLRDFPSHTSKLLSSGERTFSGQRDHVIDEKRVEALRVHEVEGGAHASPPLIHHSPKNSRRDVYAGLEGY